MTHDYCVVGGGIVGLATAMRLLERDPGASLVLLEKEENLGSHQTGHNSGVIHAGVYYAPGSLKAKLCRLGAAATKRFCEDEGIPFEVCGKLIVATTAAEVKRMDALQDRCQKNDIDVRRLSKAELLEREPGITGLEALLVPSTGIVDYRQVARAMGDRIQKLGGCIRCNASVSAIEEKTDQVTVVTREKTYDARHLIVCAGLQADRLAAMAGLKVDYQVVPFRGEYFALPQEHNRIIRHLIYPVPDPDLPFLGIHLTRMIDGGVTVGPNAVLGLGRESYPKGCFSGRDIWSFVTFLGFWRMLARNYSSATTEARNSLFKRHYLEQCRKYCPSLKMEDLQPHVAGIRAQLVHRDGSLVHDFLFEQTKRMLHVSNAPSPAATSAIPIADCIIDKLEETA